VQQQGAATAVQRKPTVSTPGDRAESQADRFADAFTVGAPTAGLVTAGLAPEASIHRFDRDEHRDIPTKNLKELYAFLATPEGIEWAKKHGQDAVALRARMKDDPVIKGESLHGGADSAGKGKRTEYSFGEPTALMGDLYGKWEDLNKASPEEKQGLMNANSTADYQKFSHGKYLELAKNNDDHFAGKNQEAWLHHHRLAIETAGGAGNDNDKFEQALFIDAAGAHFLTDAFSSGHQFEKSVVLAAILKDLKDTPLQTVNPQMQAYAGALGDDNTAQLIVKIIHDRLNQEGFPIENGLGMKWRTFGDDNLSRSPETQRIAALAVFESRQQVIQARTDPTAAAANIKSVQKFFPTADSMRNAELTAISYIPEARKHVEELIHKERESAPGELKSRVKVPLIGKIPGVNEGIGWGLGKVVESNIDAVGDPARQRELELNQQLRDARGDHEPHVEPSFTIKRW